MRKSCRTGNYQRRDRATWERIFEAVPPDWFTAPPSDAMVQCRRYFAAHPCVRLLDLGCGIGRWVQFLAGDAVRQVIGIDYAKRGVKVAADWAQRSGINAAFVVGSVTALPFTGRTFDGVLAALMLDGLSRADGLRTMRACNAVVQPGARGFFVFNPILTAAEVEASQRDNSTRECMHVSYEDAELGACLPGWSVTRVGTTLEGFRVVEARIQISGEQPWRQIPAITA